MSLLLDALKRAEQEKLARQGERGAAPDTPSTPEPAATAAKPAASSFELESLEPARAPPPASPAAAPGERANAQAMFAAKAEALPRDTSKLPLLIGAATIAAVVIGGIGYVWYQINEIGPKPYASRAGPNTPAVKPITPAAPPELPASGPPPGMPASSAPSILMPPAAPVPAPASGAPLPPQKAPPVALLRPESVSPQSRKSRPPPADAEKLVLGLLQENAKSGPAPELRMAKSFESPRVLPEVAAGYEALRRGDLPAARRSYQAALAGDPTSVDAMLGLATVDARTGERASAARHYRRALAFDARNATALAGLAAVADYSRPEQLEASLKADLARYPQSAALHMTLGNLYASRSRWPDAQAAFFEAHRLEPANADILYNLAVSLDNLGQSKLAADYYRRSLSQARGNAVQFDARAAERRLAELRN